MSQPENISQFPIQIEKLPPLSDMVEAAEGIDRAPDPTRDIRALIDQLQLAVRDAQARQRLAEDERDHLEAEVRRLRADNGGVEAAERKIAILLQERDGLAEQQVTFGEMVADLRIKVDASDHQRREALRERDESKRLFKEAHKTIEQSVATRDDAMKRLNAALRQRDFSNKERDEAGRELKELQALLADAQRALANSKGGKTNSEALQKQITSVRQARDAAAAQAAELKARVGELEDQIAEMDFEREASDRVHAELSGSAEELKKRNSTLKRRNGALMGKARRVSAELKELKIELERRSGDLVKVRSLLAEAESGRDAAARQGREKDEEIAGLKAAIAKAEEEELTDPRSLKNHERTRLQMIEVCAQLETAQHQIRELSASLAEARLQGRALRKSSKMQVAIAAETDVNADVARSVIETLRRCLVRLRKSPTAEELIRDLQKHTRFFAEGAVVAGQRVIHRIAVSLGALLNSLAGTPSQGPAAVGAIGDTIEFLSGLLDERDLDQRVKLEKTRAFIVDDEQDVCDLIADALKTVGVQPRISLNAGSAIAEMADSRYDVVFVDVFLPDLNGFDLCSHIRSMELHNSTPVIFVSGDDSPDHQREAIERGGSGWIAKPPMPEEIGLRALTSITQAQLQTA